MQLIPVKYFVETTEEGTVTLEVRSFAPFDKQTTWVIARYDCILTRELEFVYEKLPSSRTEEFIRLSRFDSEEEALNYWEQYKRLASKQQSHKEK